MRKKLVSMLLGLTVVASLFTGCGKKDSESTTTTKADDKKETSADEKTDAPAVEKTVTDGGKVLNIYCWNTEFQDRIKAHYKKYEEVDATTGKIGDVTVKWNITPNENNAYQNNLDEKLIGQDKASADDKVDIFLIEADYALKYVDADSTAALAELDITDKDLADQYQYTKDVVTDSKGVLKGSSWQGCPGALFYNRDIAKEVFGSEEPADIQKYVKDWDTFTKTAETLKEKGYSIVSSVNDTYRVYSNNVSKKWVEGDKVQIDDNLMKWVDDSKKMVDAGQTDTFDLWGDDWKKGFFPSGKVFCYFGPAWLINFCMAADEEGSVANLGRWAATEGPQGFFWGGTWICCASGSDNAAEVKDIILTMTADPAVLQEIVEQDDDFANSQTVMNKLASGDYSSKVMGGQNPLGIFAKGVASLDLSNISEYDQACNEEFQKAMKNYFIGKATKEEALDLFKKGVQEKHQNLSF